MLGYSRALLGYIGAVTLAATLLVALQWPRAAGAWSAPRLLLAAALTALVALAMRYELHLSPRTKVAVDTVWLFAALLALGPVPAALVGALGTVLGDRLQGRDAINCWFDAAMVACALASAGLAAALLARPFPLPERGHQDVDAFLVVGLAAALVYVVNVSLVAGLVALDLGVPYPAAWLQGRSHDLVPHAALFLIGLLLVLALQRSPALLLPLAALVVLVYLALRAALQRDEAEQEPAVRPEQR